MAKIITTREIFVHLNRGPRNLERTTTKHVDASIKVVQPKNPQKPVTLSTANLPDVQDIIDKKKRDDIMAERKLYLKDQKKLAINEKGESKEEEEAEPLETVARMEGAMSYVKSEEQEVETEEKPWKDMTEEERQIFMKERMGGEKGPKLVEPSKKVKAELKIAGKKLEMAERMKKVRAGKKKGKAK